MVTMKSRCTVAIAVMAVLCVGMLLLGCSAPERPGPAPQPTPSTSEAGSGAPEATMVPATVIPSPTPPLYAPTVVGWPPEPYTQDGDGFPEPPFHFAANPSVNMQIRSADAIVRATLVSDTDGILRFKVAEYLKGSGPSEITIRAQSGRDKYYDNREAILFLASPAGATGSGGTGSGRFDFVVGTTERYRGGFPSGHGINRRNRAWMPAAGTSGATGDSGSTTFDPGAPAPGRMHEEPWSVEQIKEAVAWMSAQNNDEYRQCVGLAIKNEQYYRMKAAYYGEPHQTGTEEEIPSGLPAGTVIWAADLNSGPQYGTFWTEGRDAHLFSYVAWDNDDNPRTYYESRFENVRPLPAGVYSVTTREIRGEFIICNHTPQVSGRLDWAVTVTAPQGVLHEAFFDPVTLTSGVGVDGISGVLEAAEFSVGETSASVTGLKWESGKVVLSLSTHVSLEGYRLEFIELDGSVGLSLEVGDASVDAGAGTLRWEVSGRPWEDGDLLMLRIVEG